MVGVKSAVGADWETLFFCLLALPSITTKSSWNDQCSCICCLITVLGTGQLWCMPSPFVSAPHFVLCLLLHVLTCILVLVLHHMGNFFLLPIVALIPSQNQMHLFLDIMAPFCCKILFICIFWCKLWICCKYPYMSSSVSSLHSLMWILWMVYMFPQYLRITCWGSSLCQKWLQIILFGGHFCKHAAFLGSSCTLFLNTILPKKGNLMHLK